MNNKNEGDKTMNKFIKWGLIGLGSLFALVVVNIISDLSDSPKSEFPQKAPVGETIRVDDMLWKATNVKQKAGLGSQQQEKPSGKFIIVSLAVQNVSSKYVRLEERQLFRITDSKRRSYPPIENDRVHLSRFKSTSLQRNESSNREVAFDVPKNATELKLEISGVSLRSNEKGTINLGTPTIAKEPKKEPPPEEKPPPPPPAEEKPIPAPPAKQWETAIELSGNTDKRSDIFELKGGKTKLTYNVSGSDMVLVTIYVLEEGSSLEEGGIPEVMVDKPGSDTTFLTKGAGRYYLDVSGVSDNWSIKIEEER